MEKALWNYSMEEICGRICMRKMSIPLCVLREEF